MSNISLRVHIIPVGRDPPERILIPLKRLRPERIYLLTVRGKDAFSENYNKVKDAILSDFLVNKNDLIEKKCDYYNLLDMMETLAKICYKEKKEGNQVFINISGGTMIGVAGTLARLFFGAQSYFGKKDYLKNIILEDPVFPEIPDFNIEMPMEEQVLFLQELLKADSKNGEKGVSRRECIDLINNLELYDEEWEPSPKYYNKLAIRFLDGFQKKGYIENIQASRRRFHVTEQGKFISRVFSAYYGFR